MAPKLSQPCCAKLLIAVSVLVCTYGVSAATDQTMGYETPLHALDLDQSHSRVYRHLRAADDASFEERMFENIAAAKLIEKLKPDKQKAANKYFAKLNLHKTTFNLFENPAFQKFERFVAKSYKKTSDAGDAAILTVLTTHHRDEVVAQMLVAAKEVPHTKALATRLEGVQISNWIRQEKTADDVFKLMKLDQEADYILQNPALKSWIRYVDALSEDPYKLLLVKMKTRYSDLELAGIFAGTKRLYSTRSVAEGMEKAQLNRWLSEKVSAESAFKLLKLDEEGDKLFQNPLVNTWASYMKTMDSSNSDKSAFLALKARYGEGDFATMLLRERGSPSSLVGRLQDMQLNTWMAEEKSAGDIFKLLNLQQLNEKLFWSPVFSSWTSYVVRVGNRELDEVVASVLRTHYDGKTLASMLDAVKRNPITKTLAIRWQKEVWLSEGKSVDEVFKLLKLDEAGGNIFKNPAFGTWVSYVTKANERGKAADEFRAVAVLANKMGGIDQLELAMRLSKRIRNHHDKALADLQNLQFKQWLKEGKTPDFVSHWTTVSGPDTRGNGVILSYHDFYEANHKITS